jgi:alpha-amylase
MRKGLFILSLLFIVSISCKEDPIISAPVEPLIIPDADRWWNDDVFYEIFVRSFYDSDGNGIGDFKGIIQKLDYLNDGNPNTDTDLGVTGIWLMPIFPSPSYHGYDVTNYRNVNSDYGTLDDFKLLVSEAHKRGIKVIIDFVINHTSEQHAWFTNSASSASAEKRNWYNWSSSDPGYKGPWGQTVWHSKNNAFYYGVFWSGMPDLNFNTKAVTDEIKDITQFWYQDIGVDGFRIDAAKHLIEEGQSQENTNKTLNWWREFYAFQKNLDPGLMTVGEVWTSTSKVVPYSDQRLDYCFEFDLSYAIIEAAKNGNADAVKNKMKEIVLAYDDSQYGTFLTNHDQNRVIDELNFSAEKVKLAASILLTLPGVPYLYYGEEVGMSGRKPDEDIRKPMQWSSILNAGFTTGSPWRAVNSNYTAYNVETLKADPSSIWNHYRKLLQARQKFMSLRKGKFDLVNSSAGAALAYLRTGTAESALIVHNLNSAPLQSISFSLGNSTLAGGSYLVTEQLTGTSVGNLTVTSTGGFSDFIPFPTLDPSSSYVFVLKKQ